MSRDVAEACIEAGVAAADPERAVREQLTVEAERLHVGRETFDFADYDRIVVAGGGKAAAAIARGLGAILGQRITEGVVVTDGDTEGLRPVEDGATDEGDDADSRDEAEAEVDDSPGSEGEAEEEIPPRIEALVGDHPVPSERNVQATERVLDVLERCDERTLVVAAVTGGGSALLAAPTVPLDAFRELTGALVESGADIHEINAVRKRLSRVKGGGLAAAAAPATVLSLLVSDVVGDDPGIVASGPFAPDESSAEEALAVLDRYDIDTDESVREALETGGPSPADFGHVHTHLLVNTRTAIDAVADLAFESGYDPLVLSSSMRGEAREIALAHVAVAEEVGAAGDPVAPPAAVLSGGEVTVTVEGDGEGGPNLELALAAALDLPEGVTLASVDTDGHDGGTDVAGAVVGSETVAPADADAAREALADNDALPFLRERDALLDVESTTNVNDLRIVLVD